MCWNRLEKTWIRLKLTGIDSNDLKLAGLVELIGNMQLFSKNMVCLIFFFLNTKGELLFSSVEQVEVIISNLMYGP